MITSQQNSFLSEITSGQPIPRGKLVYFRARLADRIYELVVEKYLELEKNGLTKAELARRIQRDPAQITRWFGSPGNWTLDTFSDLLLGMGYEPALNASALYYDESEKQNQGAATHRETKKEIANVRDKGVQKVRAENRLADVRNLPFVPNRNSAFTQNQQPSGILR